MVKRSGGTDPLAVGFAREDVDPPAASAARFVELSHGHKERLGSDCSGDVCSFAAQGSAMMKTKAQKMRQKAKKLKKKVEKAEKKYLQNHTESELEIAEREAILQRLRSENSGGAEQGNADTATTGTDSGEAG